MPETSAKQRLWTTAGGDKSRRGLFASRLMIGIRPVRQLQAEASINASVVFDKVGRAYVADMGGTVFCFSTRGKEIWRVRLSGGVSATPALDTRNNRVLVATHEGRVCALDCELGKVVWSRQISSQTDPRIVSDLLLVDPPGLLVLSSWGGRFLALDSGSGADRFSWDAGVCPRAAAAADSGGNIYCLRALPGKGVEWLTVDQEGGETVLHHSTEDPRGARRTIVAAAPVLDESRKKAFFVVNQGTESTLHAWSLDKNKLDWSVSLPAAVQATPCLRSDGTLMVADLQGSVQGITFRGEKQFCYSSGTEYLLAGGVAEAGGNCFIGDPVGCIHQIAPTGVGEVIFEGSRAVQGQPSFGPDGSLHVPSCDRRVYVFASAATNS